MQDFCIRNGQYLSNESLTMSLSMLKGLVKLDLSYCKQIDDKVVLALCSEMKLIKNLSLRFLNLLSGESLKAVVENFKEIEGLDISGCFGMDLGCLQKLRGNNTLKCLLLEYLPLKTEHLRLL
jgi:hypothetical protein